MALEIKIEDIIPQRHPFVLVDQLISCNDQIIETSFHVPEHHPLVHNGRLCEGGLIENIAQTAAAGNGYQAISKGGNVPNGFIAGIKNFKLNRLPFVNSTLLTKATQQDRVMGYNLIRGEVMEGQEIIASCEMKIYCPE